MNSGTKEQKPPLIYHLGLIMAVAIWSFTYVNIKIVLRAVQPNTLALIRFLIAGVALGGYLLVTHSPSIRSRDLPYFVFCGLTGITCYNLLQNQGLVTAGATEGAILVAMSPIFIVILAAIVLKEKVQPVQSVGILMAVIGAALIATKGTLAGIVLSRAHLMGDLLLLMAGLSWAAYSIIVKRLLDKYPAIVVIAYSTFAATILLIPAALAEPRPQWSAFSIGIWVNILYLGLLASALAYLIWNQALTKVSAVTSGAYINLGPVISAVFAATILHEQIGPATIAGGTLALLGTWLAGR